MPSPVFYLISHELPQFWQRQTFWFSNFVFSVPFDFFHTKFDIPSVQTAVSPLAALFMWPPNPTPCFFVFPATCCIVIVTFSLPQLGQTIIYLLFRRSYYMIIPQICKINTRAKFFQIFALFNKNRLPTLFVACVFRAFFVRSRSARLVVSSMFVFVQPQDGLLIRLPAAGAQRREHPQRKHQRSHFLHWITPQ